MAASHRNRRAPLGVLLAVGALLTGCAQFPDEHPGAWREQPSLTPQAGPEPSIEGEAEPPPPDAPGAPPPPANRCTDPDPAVVATCLNPVGAVTVLPGGQGSLVGERDTGRILQVRPGAPAAEIARVPVSPGGDGGLTGLALSPTYAEDELVYAYVTSGSDNRVLRLAPGDRPKPVLTGIPRGPSANSGALLSDGGSLLVATGSAGRPGTATDPASLAGKVLRIDGFGRPAPNNPNPSSPVIASGLSAPTGLCGSGSAYWVTDRGGAQESLWHVRPGTPLGAPAWTWADRPGVSGCAADARTVAVSLADASALFTMQPTPEGGFTGEPAKALENSYGRFSAASMGSDGMIWLGTANRTGGRPVPSDDRVVRIQPPTGGGRKD